MRPRSRVRSPIVGAHSPAARPTRITGFTITPHRVRRGGKVTVSGRLSHFTGRWLPDGRRRIVIDLRYKNKIYTLKHRLTTHSGGRFHGIFAVPRTAAWLAVYKGGGQTDFAVASKAITIEVRRIHDRITL